MFCKNCGTQLDQGAMFCSNCGNAVIKEEQSAGFENVNQQSVNNISSSSNTNNTNSNLKNALIILLVCLVIGGLAAFVYFNFFGKDDASIIDSAINNMTDVKSLSVGLDFDMEMSVDGQKVAVKMGADSDIDIKNKMAKLNAKATTEGTTFEIPVYLNLNDKLVYFKNPTAAEWYKISLNGIIDDSMFNSSDKNTKYAIESYLRNDEFIEKVESDENGTLKYTLHFTKEVLNKMVEEDGSVDLEALKEVGLEDGFDIDLYINKKGNYVSKAQLDFSGKTIDGEKIDKFIMTISFSNIDNVDEIVIPDEAKNGIDFDFNSILGGGYEGGSNLPPIDNYSENFTITDYSNDYIISYNLPAGYEASSVNSEDFKIYRKNGMRVLMSIDFDSKSEFFEGVAEEKEGYISNGYTNVTLSDVKELVYNDKTFYYQILQYDTTYSTGEYEVYLCYELDSEHVYSITYEDEDRVGSVTEETMKDFLNFTVSKNS